MSAITYNYFRNFGKLLVIYREKEIRSITIGKEEAIFIIISIWYNYVIRKPRESIENAQNKISTKWWDSKKPITSTYW